MSCVENHESVRSLISLGRAERDRGELEAATDHYEQAASLLRTLSAPLHLAHTIRHVGDLLLEQSRGAAAERAYREALSLYRSHAHAHPMDLANTLAGYARQQEACQQDESARDLWLEAIQLYRRLGIAAGVEEAHARLVAITRRLS